MADQRLVTFEGKTQAFPADATDAEISAALNAIPESNAAAAPKAKTWTALAMAGAGAALPKVADAVEGFATSPTAAQAAGSLARNATTLSGILHGTATMNPAEVIAAPRVGWAAGKGGYFLGKGAQSAAAPVATALDAARPYAQALGTASGAQGALDLAQMAEPNRKDIGTLGVTLGDPHDPAHPALVNLLLSKASEGISKLVDKGMSAEDALAAWLKGKR